MDALIKIGERELWEYDELSSKVGKLPSNLQEPFLRSATEMAEQESDTMLKFIRESRMALRLASMEIQEEQDALQRTSRFMAQGRFHESELGERPPTRSDMSTYNRVRREQANQRAAVERYIRKREVEREKSRIKYMDDGGYDIERDLQQTPMSPDLYQEEAEEAVQQMRVSSARIENERVRQAEMVRMRKEKKRAKQAEKEEKAFELLEQATSTEHAKKKDKERQAEKVKELLEEKKRKRENTLLSLGDRADTFLGSEFRSDSRADSRFGSPDAENPKEEETKKKDKDKKKKDKSEDKKEKKKKKKKKDADLAIEMALA